MAITFKREFIISQLGHALSSKNEVASEEVEREIESQTRYRDQTNEQRVSYINALSKVNFNGKAGDVRRAVSAVHQQWGRAASNLMAELATDEEIRATAIRSCGSRQTDFQKPRYATAVEVLKASNSENLTFADLKNLGITGIERYEAIAITAGPDADGITPHTEEG